MAKRIKIKGKAPRGLSKSDRILDYRGKIVKKIASRDPDHPGIPFPSRARLNDTAPSSTRKKRVKEGNRKFIGPRQLRSELAEDREANVRASEGAPVKYIDRGPGRAGHIYEVDEGGILPFETSRREIRQLSRLQKETNPASKRRVNEILRRILDQYLGGGQEFDRDFPEVEY